MMNNQSSYNFWTQHQITNQNPSELETLISPNLAISTWITTSGQVLTSVIKYEKVSFKNQTLQHKQEIVLSQEELVHFATFLPILDQFIFFHQTKGNHHGAQPTTCNRQQQLQYDYQCYQQYNQQQPIQQPQHQQHEPIQQQQQHHQQQQQQQQQQQLQPERSSKETQSAQVNTGSKTTNWKNHGTM